MVASKYSVLLDTNILMSKNSSGLDFIVGGEE